MASAELNLERSLYIGNAFGAILFGVQLVLCFQSVYYLSKPVKGLGSQRRNNFFILYSVLLAIVIAISLAANFIFGQFTWIDHREIPGGSAAYFDENTNAWYNTFGTAAGYFGIFMSDALLLYRCYTTSGSRLWITFFPAIIFLGSTALGIVSIIASAAPNSFLLKGRPAQFGTAWISLSVSFNIIVTTIIVVRLQHAYRRLKAITSPEYAAVYTGIAAIIIESALPSAILGLVFSVLYGLNNVSSIAFAILWTGLMGLTPQLIIMRVSMGIAWSKNTMSNAPTTGMKFAAPQSTLEHGSYSTVVETNSTHV